MIDKILFENTLNKLVLLFSLSDQVFNNLFSKAPRSLIRVMMDVSIGYKYKKYENLIDLNNEVLYYYTSNITKNIKEESYSKTFTLRNPDDLIIFEIFLDKMIKIENLSPYKFLDLFPTCPAIFWDKIDDLRETSHKKERDSL